MTVLLFGHRGARGLYPENTLEGFAETVAIGVDGIELDVGVTADGIAVVSHDPALNPDIARAPDGRWIEAPGPLIRSLTLSELQRFDVGRARPGGTVAVVHPAQQPRDGARIPTLKQALEAIPATVLIELKTLADRPELTVAPEAMVRATFDAIDQAGAGGHAIVELFDWRGPRLARRLRPALPVAWLTRAETVRNARLWWDGPHPDDFGGSVPRAVAAEAVRSTWAPEHVDLTVDAVQEAHALGLRVLPWTVNDPARMRTLIAWGVDGFITDRPDLGRAAITSSGPPA